MFGCEPSKPFSDVAYREVQYVAVRNDDLAGLIKVTPPVKAYYGEYEGQETSYLLLHPRHRGQTLSSPKTDIGVMYMTPVFDEKIEADTFFTDNTHKIPKGAMGYCIITNAEVARKKFNLEEQSNAN